MSNATASSARRGAAQQPNWVIRTAMFASIGFVLLLIYVAMSRNKEDLPAKYGQRRGSGAADSVNGTAVLAALFESQGHRVHTATQLSQRLDKYNTIVWAPDDFGSPDLAARQFLETWLAQGTGRTVVYIGRDYDAASEYWRRMLSQVDDSRHDEYQRRLAHAESEFDSRRVEMPEHEPCDWFTMEADHPARKIPDFDGPWAAGVDAQRTDILLAGRLDIPEEGESSSSSTWASSSEPYTQIEILLQSENDILAHRYQQRFWNSSQVIVVANGSFTLNMGLVNKENRKLAAKLVAECGKPGNVAFLESGPAGVTIDKGGKPLGNKSFALHILGVWPISFIVLHFAALGITYCISVFPIFGRPRHLPGEARSDFGQHVAALGELLQKTKDTVFADTRIRQYQTQARRTSGQAHRTVPSESPSTPKPEPATMTPVQNPLFQPKPVADSAKPTS